MALNPVIENIEKKVKVTLNGTVNRGDAIAWNGTGFVLADASDATTNLYAQYIALDGGVSGDEINACRGCTIYDGDAPFTAAYPVYISATSTVGNTLTETRPTTAADVIQIVGQNVDTYRRRIDIKPPHEEEVFMAWTFDTTGEAGIGVVDSPLWVGPAIDTNATTEDVYFTGRFPSNVLSVDSAKIIYNSIGETLTTIAVAIITCADGATNTGDTGTAHAAALPTSIADDKLCYSDITACFDADALKANYNFTVAATAGGATAGNLQVLGLYMRYLVV